MEIATNFRACRTTWNHEKSPAQILQSLQAQGSYRVLCSSESRVTPLRRSLIVIYSCKVARYGIYPGRTPDDCGVSRWFELFCCSKIFRTSSGKRTEIKSTTEAQSCVTRTRFWKVHCLWSVHFATGAFSYIYKRLCCKL